MPGHVLQKIAYAFGGGGPGEDGTVIWTLPSLGEFALNGTIDLDTLVVQDGTLKGAVAPGESDRAAGIG